MHPVHLLNFKCRSIGAVAAIAVVMLLGLLVSCSENTSEPVTGSNADAPVHARAAKPAGDEALPALDGEYAYVLAKVLEKNAAEDTLQVEVVSWDDGRPFVKGDLAAGETGDVLCSELVFFPAGIGIGSTVVVCCFASDADAFPVTAYAIEKYDLFEERVDRWSAASSKS